MTQLQYSPEIKKQIELGEKIKAQRQQTAEESKKYRFDTLAVRGLYSMQEALENNQGSVMEPLYLSTSQAYRNADELEAGSNYLTPAWGYTRIANPTNYYLEWTLALLEAYQSGYETSCVITSSGMSAIAFATDPFLVKTKRGLEKINVVASCHIYGGTFQLFSVRRMKERGIELRWIRNPEDNEEWKSNIDGNTRFLYGETPSNPQLSFFDIKGVADIAHKNGIPLIVDSTLATPALTRPIQYGADIVVHSVTKSLTMGGLAVGGAIISRNPITTNLKHENPLFRENFAEYVKFLPCRDTGAAASPFNALMALNDLRTIRSKMDMVSHNTMKIAEYLSNHTRISRVDYPGLENHPQHILAKKYMVLADSQDENGNPVNRYGHLMSFRIDGSTNDTKKVFNNLKLIWRATDLGKIKSVATIPSFSTHKAQGEEARKIADIPPNMIRLCVGAEHPDDILDDLKQALDVL